ncbi:hypothetical protein [Synechococcus sp. RedBA-s]|uniref:hypothetical protein n=1 Tax=Synechococcus sp. RedBA-s TaxID=2823741 RepID=UPI0020CCD40A|nr:hypothetical protein [Synechococcus sp. RedBA-s]MCP9800294.1 hypothetical protein [Synechococcus sp. RedBA-s]
MSEAGARRRSRRSSPQAAAAPQPPKRWPRWLLPLVAGLAFGSGYALTDRLLALQAGGPVKLDQTFDVKPFPGTSLESLRLRYGADRQELRADLELIEAERQQNETAAKAKREAAERTRQQQETSGSQAGDSTSGSSAESGGASGAAEEAPRSEPIPEPEPPTLEAPPPPAPERQP